jgi:large subunit ribosomal protein L18e
MVKRTGPTNPYLKQLIEKLKKKSIELDAPIWKAIASKLGTPSRKRIEVNLLKIDRHTENGDTVIVPGVVLADGKLTKQVNIAAWRFSPSAIKKIKDKGKIMTIEDLLQENPRGSNVKIIM